MLSGKPVAMTGALPGRFGTARAQLHLRQIFPCLDMHVLTKPGVYVASAEEIFHDAGTLTDERSRDQGRRLLEALLDGTKTRAGLRAAR